MKKNQIAAQLYSFRDFIKTPEGVAETFSKLKKIGYDSVQLSGSLAPMKEKELCRILTGEGLSAPTSHEPGAKIINETESVIDRLLQLNCYHTAFPGPYEFPDSEKKVVELAKRLNKAAEKMAAAGIKLAYHNHNIEFIRFGNRTMLDIIYENAPLMDGEIDTFWVQAGGGNPTAWIRKLAQRMEVLHIKDFGVTETFYQNNPVMKPIGRGNLDWKEIIPAARQNGVKWFVVEHDADCADPFESFKISLNYLNENFQ